MTLKSPVKLMSSALQCFLAIILFTGSARTKERRERERYSDLSHIIVLRRKKERERERERLCVGWGKETVSV